MENQSVRNVIGQQRIRLVFVLDANSNHPNEVIGERSVKDAETAM
jgi:hypothetical protein